MSKFLSPTIYHDIISTVIVLLAIILVYTIFNFFVTRKMHSNRQKQLYRMRSFYVACVVFIMLIARIWVEGFTHLIAILGLVSAALVVTNKETIMNCVGSLIINWRELFSEGDLIQVQQYKGYVNSTGLLYFTLREVAEGLNADITGRVIRIPNGLLTNNPLINFSQTSFLLQQKITVPISLDSDITYTAAFSKKHVDDILTTFYKDKKEYSLSYLNTRNKNLKDRMSLNAKVIIQPKLEKPEGAELLIYYYCFSKDIETIQQQVWLTLLNAIKNEEGITLL